MQQQLIQIPERPPGNPKLFDEDTIRVEFLKCSDDDWGQAYFIHNYIKIYDNETRTWIPFNLWPAKVETILAMTMHRFMVILKTRQVGISWLCTAFILWNALFRPEILGLLFSKREAEAIDLLVYRVKGMYRALPDWMKSKEIKADSRFEFALSNGSRIKASSAGGSDSYSATHVLIDEADIIHESGRKLYDLLVDVEPTVGSAKWWLILASRSDKTRPNSTFKNIFNRFNGFH